MKRSVFEDVVSIGPLTIERLDGFDEKAALDVPLEPLEGETRAGIDLYGGGALWEDERALISFTLETFEQVRKATVCVNDHNELWCECAWLPSLSYGGKNTYRYGFEVDASNKGDEYQTPFRFTCGFARVKVRVVFRDGREALFESSDIICLDEPREGGGAQSGERAEESNVRDMYKALIADDDQANEWMFSTRGCGAGGEALSADDDTDWAHDSLARLLDVASDTLDLVYDGLDDEEDGFPNRTDGEGASEFDTPENRAVRLLLVSLASRTEEVKSGLEEAVSRLGRLVSLMQGVVANEGSSRQHRQSLPATALLERQLEQERSWLTSATDLFERAQLALEDFDAFVGGPGAIDPAGEFAVPAGDGIYATDERYAQLREAMVLWGQVVHTEVGRREVTLHAIKPDRLFEYYALHKMLAWLFAQGFREDPAAERPIDRFEYSIEKTYDKYDNEWRCANTYRLARTLADGSTERVRLYYQPVIYGDAREENGIRLHRIGSTEAAHRGIWTPDYLLVIDDAKGRRTYALDAKYCSWYAIVGREGKLAECVRKYVLHTSRAVGGAGGSAVDGVWILSGRLDTRPMTVFDAVEDGLVDADDLPEGKALPCGVVPWNRNTGSRKSKAFFARIGIEPRQS